MPQQALAISISSILVALLCPPVVTVTASSGVDGHCSYDYEINCQGGLPYVATTSVTLASTASSSGGEAYVTFHWGGNHADSNVGSVLRPNHSPQTYVESHSYNQQGGYNAGVSILFGAGSGCEGVELEGYKLLKFDDVDCEVIDLENDDDSLTLTTSSSTAAMKEEDVASTTPPPLISASFSTCSFQYEIDCNNTIPYSATAWVAFDNPNYEASVTFHWGLGDNSIGSKMYTPSQPEILDSFAYANEGQYYVGYTVVFGDQSGCEGMKFQGYKWVWYDDRLKSCDVVDDESVSTTTSPPISTTNTAASLPVPVSTPPAIESTITTTTFATSVRSCSYDYEVTCNNPHSAMAYVTFDNPSYVASITFHWDTANTVIDSRYYSNTQPSMANSYDFGTEGVYKVGVTIDFGEGYGCDDVVYETYHIVSFDGLACQVTESNDDSEGTSTTNDVVDNVTNNAPIMSGIELLGDAVSDSTGTNAPTIMSSASTVASGTDVTSPPPLSLSAPISSMTTPPANTIAATKQESSSPSTRGITNSATPVAGPTMSTMPTYLLTTELATSSPSATPRTGTAPIPVSKNMLTSSGDIGTLSWFTKAIYSVGIVCCIFQY